MAVYTAGLLAAARPRLDWATDLFLLGWLSFWAFFEVWGS
jgi:hypothetical protein